MQHRSHQLRGAAPAHLAGEVEDDVRLHAAHECPDGSLARQVDGLPANCRRASSGGSPGYRMHRSTELCGPLAQPSADEAARTRDQHAAARQCLGDRSHTCCGWSRRAASTRTNRVRRSPHADRDTMRRHTA